MSAAAFYPWAEIILMLACAFALLVASALGIVAMTQH